MGNSAVNTKLSINLSEGTVDVEGNEDFVRFIYQDFKDSLSKHMAVRVLSPKPLEQEPETPRLTDQSGERKKRARKTPATTEGGKPRAAKYKPKFNTDLDLTGLVEFHDKWDPKDNSEKILVFAVFLRDHLKIEPCTADDIYTCFFALNKKGKGKIPTAFEQSFRNAEIRTHFIEFVSPQEVRITIAGQNHYMGKKNEKQGE